MILRDTKVYISMLMAGNARVFKSGDILTF